MEEFKGFNYNISDDVETIFDVCDNKYLPVIQKYVCAKDKKEYLAYIKEEHRPIDFIYLHLIHYYKDFEKDEKKANAFIKKLNPFYCALNKRSLKYPCIALMFSDFK